MAPSKKDVKNFNVFANVTVEVYKQIPATSLEQALELGQAMKFDDLIELPEGVDLSDSTIEIGGVHKS